MVAQQSLGEQAMWIHWEVGADQLTIMFRQAPEDAVRQSVGSHTEVVLDSEQKLVGLSVQRASSVLSTGDFLRLCSWGQRAPLAQTVAMR